MQDLCKALRDQQGNVDEPVHAVCEACLGFAVELLAGLVHAFLPANVVELMDLQGERRMSDSVNIVPIAVLSSGAVL